MDRHPRRRLLPQIPPNRIRPPKAVGVDCGARFIKAHGTTNPVVNPISHGWHFDDPVFLKVLTFTLAGGVDRNVIPSRVTTPTLSLAEK